MISAYANIPLLNYNYIKNYDDKIPACQKYKFSSFNQIYSKIFEANTNMVL